MNGKSSKKAVRRIVIAAAIFMALVIAVFAWMWCDMSERYSGKAAVRIYVPRNIGEPALRDTLISCLGDGFGSKVYRLWRLQGSDMDDAHGSYVVNPGDKAWSISRSLRYGRQTPVRVTFNNIRTMQQLSERIASRMSFDADGFMSACDSVLPYTGFAREEYPAAFLPDTYEFYWDTPAVKVVETLAAERNRFWNEARRGKASSMGLSPVEVATIASIVEEETAKSDERPIVARLYINRLDKGMRLQADPTVKFALGDFSLRRIGGGHLKVNSPYNTYMYPGLPPGPIRIPERTTMDAVLDAPAHGYIYLCAKEDFSGYHNFAADYSTHVANARRYQAELNRRNIR